MSERVLAWNKKGLSVKEMVVQAKILGLKTKSGNDYYKNVLYNMLRDVKRRSGLVIETKKYKTHKTPEMITLTEAPRKDSRLIAIIGNPEEVLAFVSGWSR